jgi:hypothetical protein
MDKWYDSARYRFLQSVAEALRGRAVIGDGDVHRAIIAAQRAHFHPPLDNRVEPRRYGPRAWA